MPSANAGRVPATYLDHWVYVAKGQGATVLYVGVTGSGVKRFKHHRAHAQWGRLVKSFDIEHFPTRQLALDRERELIAELDPPFNTQHRPKRPPVIRPIPAAMHEWWPELLTAEEVSEVVRVSAPTVRGAIDDGRLSGAVTLGGRRYITTQERLEQWLEAGRPEAAASVPRGAS